MNYGRAPRSPAGLRGSNAVDMREQLWGELRAISQGWQGRWWFECTKAGHRQLLNANSIRHEAKTKNKYPICKECERCPK